MRCGEGWQSGAVFLLALAAKLTAAFFSAQGYRFRLVRRVTSSCYAQEEVTKKKRTRHPAPIASHSGFVCSSGSTGARCDGASLARHSSRGIQPLNPLRTDSSHPPDVTVSPCMPESRVDNRVALSTKGPLGGKTASGVFHPAQAVRGTDIPSAGLCRGAFGMDGPSRRPSEQQRRPGCRGGLLLPTFLGQARTVRRPVGRNRN